MKYCTSPIVRPEGPFVLTVQEAVSPFGVQLPSSVAVRLQFTSGDEGSSSTTSTLRFWGRSPGFLSPDNRMEPERGLAGSLRYHAVLAVNDERGRSPSKAAVLGSLTAALRRGEELPGNPPESTQGSLP